MGVLDRFFRGSHKQTATTTNADSSREDGGGIRETFRDSGTTSKNKGGESRGDFTPMRVYSDLKVTSGTKARG